MTPSQESWTLLLAEDDAVSQLIVRTLLEAAGHRIVVVGTGQAAIEALRERTYDAVLMDMQMPQLGGLEATRIIRSEEADRGGRVPIIALTAQDMAGDEQRCLEAGMDGFLPKPVRSAALLRMISQLLGAPEVKTASSRPEEAVIDPARLLRHAGGDEALVKEVVGLFLAESPALWASIDEAAGRGDAQALFLAAHKLKGTLLNLAAGPALSAVLRLEELIRQGHLEEVRQPLATLRLELSRLKGVLEEMRGPFRG
jgi:two-component system sensor histidine kinase/response regulator